VASSWSFILQLLHDERSNKHYSCPSFNGLMLQTSSNVAQMVTTIK
jgi:hypothetical protein